MEKVELLEKMYSEIPFADYSRLRLYVSSLNEPLKIGQVKHDIEFTSPVAAVRKQNADAAEPAIVNNNDLYGIIIRVDEPSTPNGLKKIYIDTCRPDVVEIEHPDFFDESNANFKITNYKNIEFYATTKDEETKNPPIRGGLAKIKLGAGFPGIFEKNNKFLGMFRPEILFTPAEGVTRIHSEAQVFGSEVTSELAQPMQNSKPGERPIRAVSPADISRYGAKSAKFLAELEEKFSQKVRRFIDMYENEYPGTKIVINCAFRTLADQAIEYAKGRTTSGPIVTKALPGDSPHNYRMAIDVHFSPDGYKNIENFTRLGEIAKKIPGVLWGGTFGDRPHLEDTRWRRVKKETNGRVV